MYIRTQTHTNINTNFEATEIQKPKGKQYKEIKSNVAAILNSILEEGILRLFGGDINEMRVAVNLANIWGRSFQEGKTARKKDEGT